MSTAIQPEGKYPIYEERLDDFYPELPDTGTSCGTIGKSDEGYSISMAIPGLKKEDVHIYTKGNKLTVHVSKLGRSDQSAKERGNNFIFSEDFIIPENADWNKVEVRCTETTLIIVLPIK